ncbi:hypothetical protein I8935_06665 [Campylobacter coli]|uniref:Uncharacterized protein n=3 Tax=Campylobacter coli TaxID=195 RepID=A0A0Q2P6A7_CAMCO|nr:MULTISPECIES: hypothetical protein [Campylobacter]EAI7420951.1 hypothetical protein [Campylobacter hyointestinalis]EAK5660774.1 hypothetical protein [Campylobacter fetus]EIA57613.1 hypothetical protein cco115_01065 [Campylobacter coli 2692]EIA58547.1 hypothetical protein cco117_01265 [Campylobacter coli 2698]EIA73412.1 hypothetical protein cco54_07414 [Campylobacter coli 1891]EIB07512.1 hypothetical protein cco91_00265 [Campylobacter coli H6]KDA35507.1 hypothetical protein N218_14625 [Cam
MQVSYKTISSYEYDAISGQYKQVDKQVEDYSSTSDSDFMDILSKLEENSGISSTEENLQNNTQSSNSNSSQYAQMSSMYAYRFRQNEGELSLKAQSASVHNDLLNQNANGQNKDSSLLGDLLNAI